MIFLRAILFDFDGLLVDTEPIHFEGFRQIVQREGVELNEAIYYDRYVGYDDFSAFPAILGDANMAVPTGDALQALVDAKTQVVGNLMRTDLQAKAGAKEFVEQASQTFLLGVCSGALRNEIEIGLDVLGIRHHMEAIVSAEDVKAGKPNPEGYRSLIGLLNTKAVELGDPHLSPELCCVLEDTCLGAKSGRDAGCWTVGVHGTEKPGDLEKVAHLVLPTLADTHPADLAGLLEQAVS